MNRIPYFHLTTFSHKPFAGNPAGVCILPDWPSGRVLLNITAETRLPVVAFLVIRPAALELRWFTAVIEEDMCGHGTFAVAWVYFNVLEESARHVAFETRAGTLNVSRISRDSQENIPGENAYSLDLPARPPHPIEPRADIDAALGATPVDYLQSSYNIVVFAKAAEVAGLMPDFKKIALLDRPGLIVTAPGDGHDCDIVTRYFAPAKGIPEDAVTGSAHAQIVPYWSRRLGKTVLQARQLSSRTGSMICEDRGAFIRLTAAVCPIMQGELLVGLDEG